MIENIMKGAKFGDRFMTRDNTKVLFFTTQRCHCELLYEVIDEDGYRWFVDQNGYKDHKSFKMNGLDIVSRGWED